MSKNASRSGLLTAFVIANLVFWILIAVAVGVLASDLVDLGIESFFRETGTELLSLGIAPAQAPSDRVAEAAASEIAVAESPAQTAPQAEPEGPGEAALAPADPAEAQVRPQEPGDPAPGMAMTPSATRTPDTQPALPTEAVAAEAGAAQPTVVPQQEATRVEASSSNLSAPPLESDPLLLVDPGLDELNALDAEMQHSAAGRPVHIQVAEGALNRELAAALARYGELPYTGVAADLQPGGIILSGEVSLLGLELPTEVRGAVRAVNCRPVVQIDSVSVGGILTPRFVKQQVVQLVEESLSWYPADYPLCLEQIVIEENRATVYGSRR